MPLYKLTEFDPNYQETFGGEDVKAMDLYTEGEQKVGTVADVLVDPEGRFRYLVIDTSLETVGKEYCYLLVLLALIIMRDVFM